MITRSEIQGKSPSSTGRARAPAACLLGLALAACASPRQAAPDAAALVAGRPAYLNAAANPDQAPFDEGPWWRRFGDPALDRLVDSALASNHDVRIALARVEQARAGSVAAGAGLLPSVSAAGARSGQNTNYAAAVRQRLPDTDVRRAGFDLSWEVDLFGAVRAARNAAREDFLAAEHARRGAELAVLSETARQYFVLRGAQDRLAIVDALVGSERETLRLTGLRRAAGEASDFDIDRAQAELSATQAQRPALMTLVEASGYRLATLTGQAPGAWAGLVAAPAPQPEAFAVSPGQPAGLLARRPDLMAAAAQLRAAGFRREAAQANRYPQLLLSATLGTQWTAWNSVDLGATHFKEVAATLAMPIFAGGRIQAGIDAAGAREREALAAYEQALLQALEEVESALVALHNEAARAQDLETSVAARERALQRARALYREGQGDLLLVLDVERGLLSARLEQSERRTGELLALVQVYRALGGGWQAAESGRLALEGHP